MKRSPLEATGSYVPIFFVEQDDYYDRPELYRHKGEDYKDNCERFVFFCRAVLESVLKPRDAYVQGTELHSLYGPAQELEARMRESPTFRDVSTSLELRNPEIQINILRDRAAALGVSPQQIENTLYNAYGGRRISITRSANASHANRPAISG